MKQAGFSPVKHDAPSGKPIESIPMEQPGTTSNTAAIAHASATRWLTEVHDTSEARVQELSPISWRAVIVAPHPMAEDITVRAQGAGVTRLEALEACRNQLTDMAARMFGDPEVALNNAITAREAYLFTRGPRSIHRVGQAVRARGAMPPSFQEVNMAALRLKVDRGHEDHTIGDVVGEILYGRAQRHQGRAETRQRQGHAVGQSTLPV